MEYCPWISAVALILSRHGLFGLLRRPTILRLHGARRLRIAGRNFLRKTSGLAPVAWRRSPRRNASGREQMRGMPVLQEQKTGDVQRWTVCRFCRSKKPAWEARFKCQTLLDDTAVLSAMAYAAHGCASAAGAGCAGAAFDLNPVRAKICDSLEASEHTSARAH